MIPVVLVMAARYRYPAAAFHTCTHIYPVYTGTFNIYPVYTGTPNKYKTPPCCFVVHKAVSTWMFLESYHDVETKRRRTDPLLAGPSIAPQNDLLPLSQPTKCALLAVTAFVRRRSRRAFSTSALSTHDRAQTNESRSERRFTRALCMALRARRPRLHMREREMFAREPTRGSLEPEYSLYI